MRVSALSPGAPVGGIVPLFDPSGYCHPHDCHHPRSVGWKWLTVDHCKGSIAPSKAPVFVSLINKGKCPKSWGACTPTKPYNKGNRLTSGTTTNYEGGDQATLLSSSVSMRSIVYACREWPNSDFCNQGAGIILGTTLDKMAWTREGSCTDTLGPTTSPMSYADTLLPQEHHHRTDQCGVHAPEHWVHLRHGGICGRLHEDSVDCQRRRERVDKRCDIVLGEFE